MNNYLYIAVLKSKLVNHLAQKKNTAGSIMYRMKGVGVQWIQKDELLVTIHMSIKQINHYY